MIVDKNFWQNKKVLVTGHTGFKGSWLGCLLKFLGSEIWGLSDYKILSDNYKSLNNKEVFSEEFTLDIFKDVKELDQVLKNEFDIVFHLAAQGIVSTASKLPLETINANVLGTYNLLESVNENKLINNLVISTTDKVYLNSSANNIETDQLGGKEFYSASKAATEHIVSAFINTRKRDDLFIGVVRSGNVLGGGDGANDRIVTDVVSSLKNNSDIYLRNPKSIRPWQFILDSLTGYLLTAQYCDSNNADEIFNLNSEINNKYTVENLTESIKKIWANNSSKIQIIDSDFYETEVLKINSQKAKDLLNWSAEVDIESIASYIVKWEKENLNGNNITFDQIDSYLNK